MSEIITERSGSILRVQLNRPAKKNAMTSSMYTTLVDLLNSTAKDDRICVVLWHGAGDSFCAGNDVEDFVKNPPGPGESPQALLMNALINFDKPLVAGRETGWRATGLQKTLNRSSRELIEQAMRVENEEFASQVHSADTTPASERRFQATESFKEPQSRWNAKFKLYKEGSHGKEQRDSKGHYHRHRSNRSKLGFLLPCTRSRRGSDRYCS